MDRTQRDAALAKARQAQADKRARGEVIRPRTPAERAALNPRSAKLAIAAKCWDCVGADSDPNPRWRIGNCPVTRCALHPQRPHQAMSGRPVPPSLACGGAELSRAVDTLDAEDGSTHGLQS